MSHLLHRPSGRNLGVGLSVLVLMSVSLGVWLFLTASESPPADISPTEPVVSGIELDGIDMGTLPGKLSLLDAAVQPGIGRDQAERVVAERSLFSKVNDAVFAQAEWGANCNPCNAWVMSMDVSGRSKMRLFVAAVDADTGEYLGGVGACNMGVESCP